MLTRLPLPRASPLPLAGRGWGWGSKSINDSVHDAIDILSDIRIPDTKDTKALIPEVALASRILGDLYVRAVSTAVNLDDKPVGEASEVDDEAIYRHLPPELEPCCLQAAQVPPE